MSRSPNVLLALALTFGLVAAACGADEPSRSGESASSDAEVGSVVVLGDSIMAWNAESGESIPDVIGNTLGVSVTNAAESGAWMTDVPDQYAETDRRADWVVFDGGGNDLNDTCGCGACDGVLDSLLSTDGTSGVIADFTEGLLAAGKNVAVVGYYELPPDAEFGFDDCADEVDVLKPRWAALADRFATVIYVDPSQVVTASDRAAFDRDSVHPSPAGSRIVGEQIAAAISAEG